MASSPTSDTAQLNAANAAAHTGSGMRGKASEKYSEQHEMSPVHTLRQASRKMAATMTVPAGPKCALADAARMEAPLAASGIVEPIAEPTNASPQ